MKEKLALFGSMGGVAGTALAATLGSACCVGPASVALLGVNGAIFAVQLQPYRTYLLAASVTLLALSVWLFLRPSATCEPGSCG